MYEYENAFKKTVPENVSMGRLLKRTWPTFLSHDLILTLSVTSVVSVFSDSLSGYSLKKQPAMILWVFK